MKKKKSNNIQNDENRKKSPLNQRRAWTDVSEGKKKKKKMAHTLHWAFVCAGNWQEVRPDRVAVAMVWPLYGERKKATKRQLWTPLSSPNKRISIQ